MPSWERARRGPREGRSEVRGVREAEVEVSDESEVVEVSLMFVFDWLDCY